MFNLVLSLSGYNSVCTTVWCNQMGSVFAEMSSWTALTRHLGMKTAFYTKYIKVIKFFKIFILMFFILHNKYENVCAVFLYTCISCNHLQFLNLHNKDPKIFALYIFCLNWSSLSLYAKLKLSKTTSPQNLFRSDCVTP